MTRKEILEKTIDFDDAIHRIVRLEKENAYLKKSCDETQELLDKQIEATYKLVEENAELKKEVEKHKWNNIFLEDCTVYDKKITEEYTTLQEHIEQLEKENAEAKNLIEELASSLSVVGECDEEECELINKARKFINEPIF